MPDIEQMGRDIADALEIANFAMERAKEAFAVASHIPVLLVDLGVIDAASAGTRIREVLNSLPPKDRESLEANALRLLSSVFAGLTKLRPVSPTAGS